MRTSTWICGATFVAAAFCVTAFPLAAQQENPSATVPVRAVVTVLGKNFSDPPAIGREDIQAYDGKTRLTVTEWMPAQGEQGSLDFALLIDEECDPTLGLQLNDLKDFITQMPVNVRVGVFYASNGTVKIAQNFTADHAAAAKSIRLPLGSAAAFSSEYLSIMDLIKRWPTNSYRREMLLVADGIDRFRGGWPSDPDVDAAIERAQKSGVMIHTIYATGVGRVGRNFFRLTYGQSNLARLADGSGGESFFQGTETPIAYAPFMKQLATVLKNQYHLTALAKPGKKGGLRRIRIRTEVSGAEISAPDSVYVAGVESK